MTEVWVKWKIKFIMLFFKFVLKFEYIVRNSEFYLKLTKADSPHLKKNMPVQILLFFIKVSTWSLHCV